MSLSFGFGFGFGSRRRRIIAVTAAVALAGTLVVGFGEGAFAALPTGPTTTGLTGARPSGTRLTFPIDDHSSATVDVVTGNLMVATTWMTLEGIKDEIPIGGTYNSLATNTGSSPTAPANKWTYSIDKAGSLSQAPSGVVYTAADGSTWLFAAVSGSTTTFTSPAGLKEVLAKTATAYTLTDLVSQQVVTFTLDGIATKVVDRNGNKTTIGSDATEPTSIAGSLVDGATVQVSSTVASGQLTFTRLLGTPSRSASIFTTGGNLTKITSTDGNDTTFTYTSGLMTSITSPTGAVTNFTYDAANRVAQIDELNTFAGSPGTSTTRITHPSATQALIAGPNTSTGTAVATGPHTTYTVDAATKLVTASVDAAGRNRAATYTPNLDVATSTSGSGTTAGTTTATYGANGGMSATAIQAPGGATDSAAYANTAPGIQYLPSSTTNDAGNATTYTYNGSGNALTSQNTTLAATATLTYNSNGQVITAAAPGNGTNVTTYAYNSHHQLATITPVTGTSLGIRTFTWNAFDQMKTSTDGRGITTSYTYDTSDRLLTTSFSDGTPSVTNTYDKAGRLKSRVDGSGTTTYTYDQIGRITARQSTSGGGTLSYGYDKASNLTSMTDTRGTTTYAFDASGVATQMVYTDTSTGVLATHTLGFASDTQGRRTDSWLDTNAAHTTWIAHSHTDYDTSGRVTHVLGENRSTTTGTATTQIDQTYCYNSGTAPTCNTGITTDRSKLKWSKDNITGNVSIYTYDAGGRLTQTAQPTTPVYTYTYDSRGNRLTDSRNGQTLTYNAANQITSPGYTYDAAGNLTTKGQYTYTYNGAEQLTSSTLHFSSTGSDVYSYGYAGTNQNEAVTQRHVVNSNSDGGLAYGRSDAQGQPEIEQVFFGSQTGYVDHDPVTGQALTLRDQNGIRLYVFDGTGNPSAILGSTNSNLSWDPYGGSQTLTGTGNMSPYVFKGSLLGFGAQFVRFGARWYDPQTGSFVQQDTLDSPLDPSNANRYAYAGDDPVNNQDPTGEDVSGSCFAQAGRVLLGTVAFLASSVTIVGFVLGVQPYFQSILSEPHDAEGNFLC